MHPSLWRNNLKSKVSNLFLSNPNPKHSIPSIDPQIKPLIHYSTIIPNPPGCDTGPCCSIIICWWIKFSHLVWYNESFNMFNNCKREVHYHKYQTKVLDLVLWHINRCRLFNAKSSLYIKYIEFGLVGFYGLSTIVGYLKPNPLYTYILDIYDFVWLGFMAYQPM